MVENIQAQMRKGVLEYCVLSIIAQKEVYTSDILEGLKKANLIVVEGTIYPLLSRLKNAGYLSYRWQESTEGPPRKYFSLTQQGVELLETLDAEWAKIDHAVSSIKKTLKI